MKSLFRLVMKISFTPEPSQHQLFVKSHSRNSLMHYQITSAFVEKKLGLGIKFKIPDKSLSIDSVFVLKYNSDTLFFMVAHVVTLNQITCEYTAYQVKNPRQKVDIDIRTLVGVNVKLENDPDVINKIKRESTYL